MACMSEGMRKKHHALKRFLRDNLYSHYRVSRMTHKARNVIKVLFESFAGEPELLPDEVRRKIKRGSETGESAERFIADYIAGMTDRYAIAEYDRISNPRDTSF
jgi:dGTPase